MITEKELQRNDQTVPQSLSELERRLKRDLDLLNYPRPEWLRKKRTEDDRPILDVLIIGGGQGGLAVAHALMREKVSNILVIDKNPRGHEGPWRTFARMLTLRTPKHLTGPDGGVPNLTPRSWYEAQHGEGSWDKMGLIPKETWARYLDWYREFLGIPVENNCTAGAITWDERNKCLSIPVQCAGQDKTLLARKVVLATGIEGSGRWSIPSFISDHVEKQYYAHTHEDIDFDELKGKRIAVLGAGASAFDNSSVALENGAKEVHLYFRRKEMVRVNPYRWAEFVGFLKHHGDADDSTRWKFIHQILKMGQLPPADTYARATSHENFYIHPGSPWKKVRFNNEEIEIETPDEARRFDYIIVGTGFRTDLSLRKELADIYPNIALWKDRYTPEAGYENEDLSRHPYLGPSFEFQAKNPDQCSWLKNIYNYTFGCLPSLGFGGASISGMKYSVPRLVSGITRDFYLEDADYYLDTLREFDTHEF